MDFNFTEEQQMVRDGLSRLVREQYDAETRREVIASEAGWRPEIWAQLAELGILGMPFSEEDGGFGGGAVDALVVMEEFGKGLVVEPFVPTVVCAGGFLKHGGSAALIAPLLRRLLVGPTSNTVDRYLTVANVDADRATVLQFAKQKLIC